MHDALPVGMVHGPGQRLDQARGLGGRPGSAGQVSVQAAALHIFERQERPAIMRADVTSQ